MDGCVEEIYIEMYVNSVYTERPHYWSKLEHLFQSFCSSAVLQ